MLRRYLLLFLLFLPAAPPAQAQGLIFPRPPHPEPPRRVRPPQPLQPLAVQAQKVRMQVHSGALKVEVEQVFFNPHSVQVEGTYLFPLPAGATVSSFRMTIGKEPVEGKLLGVEEARRIYESYVRRNVDPALLEYVGRNAFQARVFPIPARSEKRIYLTYSQALEFSNGIYKVIYPLTSERVTGQTAGDLTIACTLRSRQPIKAVYSPTHEVQVTRESDRLARVTFEGSDVRADRDFVLYYTTSDKAFGLNVLAHRRPAEDGYLMLMLAPKREAAASEVLPKDVVVVFDTSGSMSGAKIDQARKALTTLLGALNSQDRFNIIRFSSDVTNFRPTVVSASRENRETARAFVEEFKAIGGTAIDDALQAGLASVPAAAERKGRTPFLIFMTDGLPTIGTTDIDRILQSAEKAAPPDLRLFTFGVGADVNTLLLDRLARDNRGSADYVAQDEDLETRIGAFYEKIANPVLSNVRVEIEGATFRDPYPSRMPDLFAGGQLLLLGRYRGQGKARVTLTGDLNDRPRKFVYEVQLPERELGNDFIPRLWAGRRIGFLLEEIRLKGEQQELKDEVIRLSKEWGIVTPYTSYLVEEPNLTPLSARRYGFHGRFNAEADETDRVRDTRGGPSEQKGNRVRARSAAPAGVPGPPGAAGKSEGKALPGKGSVGAAPQLPADGKQDLFRQQVRQQREGFDRSTGWNAVEASRRVRQLKDSFQALKEVETYRSVQGRRFRLKGSRWVEEALPAGKGRVVEVKFGSDAYFKLISANPDWARLLSVGREVTFRSGRTTQVAVGEKGVEKLTDAEVKALER